MVFYGVGNGHLQMIKSLYPKLRIVARDNVIRVLGDEEEMSAFEENVEKMRRHVLKYNNIGEEDILDIIKGRQTKADGVKGVIVYNISGKPIKCKPAAISRRLREKRHDFRYRTCRNRQNLPEHRIGCESP